MDAELRKRIVALRRDVRRERAHKITQEQAPAIRWELEDIEAFLTDDGIYGEKYVAILRRRVQWYLRSRRGH